MKQIKCYVAGALNADAVGYIQNLHRMCVWSEKVRNLGVSVYVPGIDFLLGVVHGDWTYEDYFENSQPWLDVSDCMFLVPGYENSKGTKKERERAWKAHIPIFKDLNKLKSFIKSWKK